MTQLGEMVAVGVMKQEGSDCPFDHDTGEPPDIKNELKGNGGTLGDNMAAASTTVTHAPNRRAAPGAEPYPSTVPKGSTPIKIDGFSYPVTCAAHHLVPAGASLKKASALLFWISKDKGGVWANAGYDVNGTENGVWLPGNYAVGGNGTCQWKGESSILPDNEHASAPVLPPLPAPAAGDAVLHGYLHDFDEGRKGQYVIQATALFKGQFHDAHPRYSEIVYNTLQELGRLYIKKFPFAEQHCGPCKQNAEKQKQLGLPTPLRIVHQLNSISRKYRSYLAGSRGHALVYTSRWGMQAEHRGISAIR